MTLSKCDRCGALVEIIEESTLVFIVEREIAYKNVKKELDLCPACKQGLYKYLEPIKPEEKQDKQLHCKGKMPLHPKCTTPDEGVDCHARNGLYCMNAHQCITKGIRL